MAKGVEILDFWRNGFPEGYYSDDCEIEVVGDNDEDLLEPDANYPLVKFGNLYPHMYNGGEDVISFTSAFNRWKKSQTTEVLIVDVPKDKAEEARRQIASLGYKVRK